MVRLDPLDDAPEVPYEGAHQGGHSAVVHPERGAVGHVVDEEPANRSIRDCVGVDQFGHGLATGLDANRDLLEILVSEHLPTTRLRRPEGTYLGWLDCRSLDLGTSASVTPSRPAAAADISGPAKFFLDNARVALSSGHVFGRGGDGHVRINFATSPAVLTEAVTRMGRALRPS